MLYVAARPELRATVNSAAGIQHLYSTVTHHSCHNSLAEIEIGPPPDVVEIGNIWPKCSSGSKWVADIC